MSLVFVLYAQRKNGDNRKYEYHNARPHHSGTIKMNITIRLNNHCICRKYVCCGVTELLDKCHLTKKKTFRLTCPSDYQQLFPYFYHCGICSSVTFCKHLPDPSLSFSVSSVISLRVFGTLVRRQWVTSRLLSHTAPASSFSGSERFHTNLNPRLSTNET